LNPSVTIIGIAGASGAGKSLLATELHRRIVEQGRGENVTILHEDYYYRERNDLTFEQRESINYDHPDALQHELLIEHLDQLKAGHSIDVPQYDYSQHNRKAECLTLPAANIIILEGILILHDLELVNRIDLKIFVDVPMDVCLTRRLRRDTQERGRSLDSVLSQYEQTVRPMYFEFIEPSKQQADLIVPRGGQNQPAVDVLHSHLQGLLSPSTTEPAN